MSSYAASLIGASLLALAAFSASLIVGPTDVSLPVFLESIVDYDSRSDAHLVARDIRLPRALLALLVGGSLGAAGAVMQGVTRNPLAGPAIMGLSSGGSLGALVALIAVPALSYNGAIVAAFVGSALACGCVLGVAALTPGGASPTRLTLAGAVMSALFAAVTQGLLIVFAMSNEVLYWTIGGIANVTWPQVAAVAPIASAGILGVVWIAPSISILSLGPEVAAGLGQHPTRIRAAAALFVLLIVGSTSAVAGPVPFIGLMTPHICRMVVGADYRRLIPTSILAGAAFTAAADLVARTVLRDGHEVPLGVVTGMLGAPGFLWLIRGKGSRRLEDGSTGGTAPQSRPAALRWSLAGLGLLVAGLAMIALQLGDADLSWAAILRTLAGNGTPEENLVLWSFRVPRIAFALLVGAGIGVSGAILQGVLRNDLAEPGILGVSSGASFAIILTLWTLGPGALHSTWSLPIAAVIGAFAAVLLICLLCAGGEQSSPRLLLTGVAVSSVLSALGLVISLQVGDSTYKFATAYSSGSLGMADWNYVKVLAVTVGTLAPLAWSFAPTLNVLGLGSQVSTGLGVPVAHASFWLLALGVALCAGCMALAGGVLFLGLVAPHIGRRLVGVDYKWVLPAAGLVGASLLLLADMLGGVLMPSVEIPAGVMVSAVGAGYFLYLMTRS